ncbi:MAG: SpvB/TcaC N-terminal domain-containing protein [Acidobacteriota bacterium]
MADSESKTAPEVSPKGPASATFSDAPGRDARSFFLQIPSVGLPKGGGALKGIDEKFSVNAVNGTAATSIPLPCTPGRAGAAPSLSLTYDSGGGNGPFGLGWSLTLPAIQRRTDKVLPRYEDAHDSDTFLLSDAEDLVPSLRQDAQGDWVADEVTDASGVHVKRYRPRIEGSFSRIEWVRPVGDGGGYWRVTTPDNQVTFYGLTVAARIVDPTDAQGARVFKWLPEISFDDKGNCAQYEYVAEDALGVPTAIRDRNRLKGLAPCANVHLKRIAYCNLDPWLPDPNAPYTPTVPTDPRYLLSVVLDYGDHDTDSPSPAPSRTWPCRLDPFSSCRAGFEIRTRRLCQRVLMFHDFRELGDGVTLAPCLVRSLDLHYRFFGNPAASQAERDNVEAELLLSAEVVSYRRNPSGYDRAASPAMTFRYHERVFGRDVKEVSPADLAGAPAGLTEGYQWVDLYNEGIAGILSEHESAWLYKSNLGDGRFAHPRYVAPRPSSTGLASGGLQLLDLDADGRKFVVTSHPNKGYFELDEISGWNPFVPFERVANLEDAGSGARLIDLDGDGRAELVISEEEAFVWYPSLGTRGYGDPLRSFKPADEERGPRVVFAEAEQTVFLADMTGDGLTDIVRIRNGEVCYWPNQGFGRFGARVTMDRSPVFDLPDRFDPRYVQLGDISGTGTADILYLHPRRLRAFLNLSGNAFGDPEDISPFPSIEAPNRITVTDFLGNGTACLVWSSPLPASANAPLRYLDLMDGRKPWLMASYANGRGKEVAFEYESSTQFYLADKRNGTPWVTKLPFPVHCLSRVTTTESVTGHVFVQEMTYHHGYYDHPEREFRGFGRVDTIDTESFDHFVRQGGANIVDQPLHQSPVLTRTWYHTGAFVRHGMLAQMAGEYYFPPGFAEHVLPLPVLPPLSIDEEREAFRACKGTMLRQETYALDGSALQPVPYTTASHNWSVQLLQPRAGNPHAVFLTLEAEALTYHYERNTADPRTVHVLHLAHDEIGNVLQSASVAYPRRVPDQSLPPPAQDEQARLLVTCVESEFTLDRVAAGGYRLRQPSETRTYELTGPALPQSGYFSSGQLKAALDGAQPIGYEEGVPVAQAKRLLHRERTLYWNDEVSTPLALGTMGSLGLRYESYRLNFTAPLLDDLFDSRWNTTLLVDGGFLLSDDYKARGLFPAADAAGDAWARSGHAELFANPAQHFYLPLVYHDAHGSVTAATYYSDYHLIVESILDAAGNLQQAEAFDFRVLSPVGTRDANANLVEVALDVRGLVTGTAVLGKGADADDLVGFVADLTQPEIDAFFADPETNGPGLIGRATTRFVYDHTSIPARAALVMRETHYQEELLSGVPGRLRYSFEYSDGMGRVAMKKQQVDPGLARQLDASGNLVVVDTSPGLRWVGNGRTVLNNKGNPVKQYEPYFSATHLYESAAALVEIGATPVLYYDPLGRTIRVDLQNGTFRKQVFDVWRSESWDENDTVLQSDWYDTRINGALAGVQDEHDAALKAARHHDTPLVEHLDTMGRTFYSVAHNRHPDDNDNLVDEHPATRVVLDIESQRRRAIDARGNVVVQFKYDMLGQAAWHQSADAGTRRLLNDSMQKPLYSWDPDGTRFQILYDALHRTIERRARLVDSTTLTFEKMIWGEGQPEDVQLNLRGQLVQQHDGAGVLRNLAYDFKANLLRSTRELPADHTAAPNWDDAVQVAMQGIPHLTLTRFDAMNRLVTTTTPDGSVTHHRYDRAGYLTAVTASIKGGADTALVTGVDHDEKGHRSSVRYSSGVHALYEYDPLVFRLARAQLLRPADNTTLQDVRYFHDAVGNVTSIVDVAQQSLYFSNQIVEPRQDFEYDALYQLVKAEGREHIGQNLPVDDADNSRRGLAHIADGNAMQRYRQRYAYDLSGNMIRMRHAAGNGAFLNQWTRTFAPEAQSNRLQSTTVGQQTDAFQHDASGNMRALPNLPGMVWDFQSRLTELDLGGGGRAWYQYDAAGQRVRKVVARQGGLVEERIYLGTVDLFARAQTGAPVLARETLHLMDDTRRVAMVDTLTLGTDGSAPQTIRFQHDNHLGSAVLELDESGAIVSYEEYYPFGSTSFQSGRSLVEVQQKRYRYTGKERDEESGLYYYGARYYAPWLARFTAADPKGIDDGLNAFAYVRNNPIRLIDPDGRESMTFARSLEVLHANIKSIRTNDDKRLMYTSAYGNAALSILKVSEEKGVPPAKALILLAQTLGEQATTIWIKEKFKDTGYRMFNMQVHDNETAEHARTGKDWGLTGVSSTRLDSSEATDRSGGAVANSPFFKFDTPDRSVGHFLDRLSGDKKYYLANSTKEIEVLRTKYAAAHASLKDATRGVEEYGAKLKAAGYARDAGYATTLKEKSGEVFADFLGIIEATLKANKARADAIDATQVESDINAWSAAVEQFEKTGPAPGLLVTAENVAEIKKNIEDWRGKLEEKRAYTKLEEVKQQIERLRAGP